MNNSSNEKQPSSSNTRHSAPVQAYLAPLCHPDHVTAERSELLPSPEPAPPHSTFHSRMLHLTGPALTAGRRSLGREGTRFPPGHLLAWTPNINTQVCTNLLSLVHTDKEVIYPGPKQTSDGAGTLLHKGCFANGELNEGTTELLPGSRGGTGKAQWSQSWSRGVEEGLSSPFHPR